MGQRNISTWFLLAGLAVAGCSGGPKDGKEAAEKDYLDRISARLNAPPPPIPPAPKASEFKPYKSPNALFGVNFPGEPQVINAGPSIPDKLLEDKWYKVELKPRVYSVRHNHFETDRDPAEELQHQIDLQVGRTLEGKVTDSKDVKFKGHPGKEVVIIDDDKGRLVKLIVVGKDVYHVFVDLPVAEVNGEDAKAFIESFELLKD
jgi:hypothetical protein